MSSFNSYSTSCKKLLLSVCEELMLPIPVELGDSPGVSRPHVQSGDNSHAGSTQHSLQGIPSVPMPAVSKRRSEPVWVT